MCLYMRMRRMPQQKRRRLPWGGKRAACVKRLFYAFAVAIRSFILLSWFVVLTLAS